MSFRVKLEVEKDKTQNSYCSAMQQRTGVQFYYVKADPIVGKQHI